MHIYSDLEVSSREKSLHCLTSNRKQSSLIKDSQFSSVFNLPSLKGQKRLSPIEKAWKNLPDKDEDDSVIHEKSIHLEHKKISEPDYDSEDDYEKDVLS